MDEHRVIRPFDRPGLRRNSSLRVSQACSSANYFDFVDRRSRTAHTSATATASAIARSPVRPTHRNLGPVANPSVDLKWKGNRYFNAQSLQPRARHHWTDCMAPKDNTVAMLSLSKCLILVCTHKLFHLRAVVQEQVPFRSKPD